MTVTGDGTAYTPGVPSSATVAVIDDEEPVTVEFVRASPVRVLEDYGNVQVLLRYRVAGGKPPGTYGNTGFIGEGYPVTFRTRSGTARSPLDFESVSTRITLSTGLFTQQPSGDYEHRATIRVEITRDMLDEGESESFEIVLEQDPGIAPVALTLPSQPLSILIEDDDTVSLSLSVDPDTVKEGGTATVSARIDGEVVFAQEESVALVFGGTATKDTDYQADGTSLTFAAESRTPASDIVITTLEDTAAEASETVQITAMRNGEAVSGETLLTVADNTPPILLTTVVDGATLELAYSEALDTSSVPSVSAYAVQVAGSPRAVSEVEVNGSAVTLTLVSAVYSGQAVTLSYAVPMSNPVQDQDGTAVAALVDQSVTNDTPKVLVSYDRSVYTATEGGADAAVTVRLSHAPGRSVQIPITVTGQGGVLEEDYSGVPPSVTFLSDDMSKSFAVKATDDQTDDDGEAAELGFGTLPEGLAMGSALSAMVQLADNDSPAVPPGAPTDLRARPSNQAVLLTWTAPSEGGGSPVTGYDYRWKEEPGSYGRWRGTGSDNTSWSVEDLRNDHLYIFQVRAVNAADPGEASVEARATPRIGAGICGRTPQVTDAILEKLGPRLACDDVSAADLAGVRGTLDLQKPVPFIHNLKSGDFAGLTGVTTLDLTENRLQSLPDGVLQDLFSLEALYLGWNLLQVEQFPFDDLEALPDLRKVIFLGNPGNLPGLLVSPRVLPLRPGGSGEYSIRLQTEPDPGGATVTIDLDGLLSSSQERLTFTRENWFRSQRVTVSVDAGAPDGRAAVRHRVTGFEDWKDNSITEGPTLTVTVGGSQGTSGGTRTEPLSRALDRPVRRAQARSSAGGQMAGSEEPQVPKLALWTDRPGYAKGELVRLYRSMLARGDEREYVQVFYLERVGGADRVYFTTESVEPCSEQDTIDRFGLRPGQMAAARISSLERAPTWTGVAPRPGLWQFVAELRTADGMRVLKRAHAKFVVAEAGSVEIGAGGETEIARDTVWTSDTLYKLTGRVTVNPGATLTLGAGTLVQARGPQAGIRVEPGGRIEVLGRLESPVVLTCDAPVGERMAGCWEGLTVRGGDPVGSTVLGHAPSNSSGSLRYLRVEFAGAVTAPGMRGAAIRFDQVGGNTVVENLQAHASATDGIVFQGGTVSCRYCVSSEAGGAGFRWGRGWAGVVSNLYVQQGPHGGSGLEAAGPSAVGLSDGGRPSLHGLTLVGPEWERPVGSGAAGIRLEGRVPFEAVDLLVMGFGSGAIAVGAGSAETFLTGESQLRQAILYRNGGEPGAAQVPDALVPYVEYVATNPMLRNTRREANPDPRHEPGLSVETTEPVGAMNNRTSRPSGAFAEWNWLQEWTFFGPESDYRSPAAHVMARR